MFTRINKALHMTFFKGMVDLFDLLGVAMVLAVAWYMHFLTTPLSALHFFQGAHGYWMTTFPTVGIISTLSAVASITSTRFIAKQYNLGNWISWINVIFAGLLDFGFGNMGAWLTYPISVVTNYLPTRMKEWTENKTPKKAKWYVVFPLIIVAFALSFGLNYLGYELCHWPVNTVYYLASITFGLALTADVLNIFKVQDQWYFWSIYNFANFGKALTQGNFANVGKYSYYIVNSLWAVVNWAKKPKQELDTVKVDSNK